MNVACIGVSGGLETVFGKACMSGSGLWMTVGHESVTSGLCQKFVGVVWKKNRALQPAE